MPDHVTIQRLGHEGDGMADTPAGAVAVPFALPGEEVAIDADGRLLSVQTASPDRQTPPCRHFGTCGGCVAQHMSPALYQTWKRDLLLSALRQQDVDTEVAPLVTVGAGTRRRAVLTALRARSEIRLGYHARRSHDLIAIDQCPVLSPAIVTRFEALRLLARVLIADEDGVRLTVVDCGRGLDVAVAGSVRKVDAEVRTRIAEIASAHGFLRVVVLGDEVVRTGPPSVNAGGVAIIPPPAGFLQAVVEIEAAMAAVIVKAAGKARRVADLFAGVGAFTFPLAARAAVTAMDSDKAALAALDAARRQAQGLKPIDMRVRDLMREPLSPKELEGFDMVVLDPPRAGAKAQAERLARSKVPVVVAVSCNPATLARDLRILVDGGYKLASATPFDQFLWSAHVEAVAVLRR